MSEEQKNYVKECKTMLLQMNALYDDIKNYFAKAINEYPFDWQFHFIYLKQKYQIGEKCVHCKKGKIIMKYHSKYNYYYAECNEKNKYNIIKKRYENNCDSNERQTIQKKDLTFNMLEVSKHERSEN